MKSRSIIMIICWITGIIYITTDMFPNGAVPAALCASWVIMELLGFFRRENAVPAGARINEKGEIEDGLSERQLEFIRKIEEGAKDNDEEDDVATIIKIMDEEGVESSITIKVNGDVSFEGTPNPDILLAAHLLEESVIKHGPEAITEELGRQIAIINNKIKRDNNE